MTLRDQLQNDGFAPNRSDVSRHAYTLHVVDGAAQYARENWLQRDAALPVRGFV